VRKYIQIILNG